jgi:leucyl/phenylalanyl-tRNA--protein transferase
VRAYTKLHTQGVVKSVEVYQDSKLVGGLYGVSMGKVFFGESMFSLVSNASKIAFNIGARIHIQWRAVSFH